MRMRTIALAVLLAVGACGRSAGSALPLSGCGDAVQARAAADAAIDRAAAGAAARNAPRAQQLQAVAQQGKQEVAAAADLRPCDAGKPSAGVAADPDQLRARYQAVVDKTAAQLDQLAAQPVPPAAPAKDKGEHGKGHD